MLTPLLVVTLAYAAGLLAGLRATLPVTFVVLLVVAAVFATRNARVRTGCVFVVVGMAVGGLRAEAVRSDCRTSLADGAAVRLAGVPRALPTEGVSLLMDARLGADSTRTCRTTVRVHAQPRHLAALDSAARGTKPPVLIRGRWMTYPQRGGWPRRPEYAGGVLVDAVHVLETPSGGVPAAGAASRFRTAQQARLRALLPERWGLAEALLLAQRAGLTAETRSRWVAAGLVHLLAISGMHVGLIVGGVLLLGRAAGLSPRAGRRVAVLVTGAYVLFLGAPSAALRALLQAAMLLGAVELQRPADPFTALAAAALAILLLEPMAVLDPGFQLSFCGMIGLIAWRRPVAALLPGRLHRHVRDGLAAGIAASALTTPVAALHFGTASWIGIPASIAAVPVMAAGVAALLIALIIATVSGATEGPHALAADLPLRVLDMIAELAARVPGGHGYLSASTVLACLAAAVVALLVRSSLAADRSALPPPSHAPAHLHDRWNRRHRARRMHAVAGAAAAVAIIAWTPLMLQPRDGRVEVHAIDVGQGDAIAIRTPGSRWILVDAGPRTLNSDAGRDRVVPYLLRHGVRRLDAMILTHPDADHIGGAAAVMEVFDVGTLIDPGFAAGKDMFIDLIAAARQAQSRWIAAREGITLRIDGVEMTMLFPASELDAASNANDNSVVFRLVYGEFTALFLGDAPMAVEERLVTLHGERLRTTLLKVGHHGSTTSTGEALLRTIRPSVALVSAGRRNRYGHPAPSVLKRLGEHGVRVLRTDMHGNITVRASRNGDLEVLAR